MLDASRSGSSAPGAFGDPAPAADGCTGRPGFGTAPAHRRMTSSRRGRGLIPVIYACSGSRGVIYPWRRAPVTGLLNQACEELEEARVVVFFV